MYNSRLLLLLCLCVNWKGKNLAEGDRTKSNQTEHCPAGSGPMFQTPIITRLKEGRIKSGDTQVYPSGILYSKLPSPSLSDWLADLKSGFAFTVLKYQRNKIEFFPHTYHIKSLCKTNSSSSTLTIALFSPPARPRAWVPSLTALIPITYK